MSDAVLFAAQGGALVFTITFMDQNGVKVTPTTITWSLSDEKGSIINGRQNISVTPATNPVVIKLNGPDTQFVAGGSDTGKRVLSIYAQYTDATLGTMNLPQEFPFDIEHLVLGGMN